MLLILIRFFLHFPQGLGLSLFMKIDLPEFELSLGDISFPVAVAVSGGADSLALLLLTHQVALQKGGKIVALTVDHALRPDSQQEAMQVQKWAQDKGIEHVILTWEGEKPTSRLQEKSREARYHLLTNWCKDNGISTLLLGHHAQDQEETFWMRLSAGSGLEGLGGMKKCIERQGVVVVRPLLDYSKERLQATLLAHNQDWIQDPSNQNQKYFRGRLRPLLEEEGLSSSRLLKVMGKLQEDADFIRESLRNALQETVQAHEGGYLTMNRPQFEKLHPALKTRLISYVMKWFSGAEYPPRVEQVQSVIEKLNWIASPLAEVRNACPRVSGEPPVPRFKPGEAIQKLSKERLNPPFTMGGIYWVSRENEILLLREKRAIKETLNLEALEEKILWDQRFWINPEIQKIVSRETILSPLGVVPGLKKEIKSTLPRSIWPTLPALWEKGNLVAIPHLCYSKVSCEKDLREFISLKPLFHDSLTFTI